MYYFLDFDTHTSDSRIICGMYQCALMFAITLPSDMSMSIWTYAMSLGHFLRISLGLRYIFRISPDPSPLPYNVQQMCNFRFLLTPPAPPVRVQQMCNFRFSPDPLPPSLQHVQHIHYVFCRRYINNIFCCFYINISSVSQNIEFSFRTI